MIASEAQGDRRRGDGASPVRRYRALPANQGKRQEYIDVLSLHRQSLQNKQCFHNQYMHTCLLRATNFSVILHAFRAHARQTWKWSAVFKKSFLTRLRASAGAGPKAALLQCIR